jgi:hexokinase
VKQVGHIIAHRAARLSSTLICALLRHTDQDSEDSPKVVVAVDGSVYEKFPGFQEMMKDGVRELLGRDQVIFVLAKEGSGYGAALASI